VNYIDLTSDKVWTDDQINRRLQAVIRSRVSQDDEMKAARLGRKAKKTAADKAFIQSVDDHISASIAEAKAISADNSLLRSVVEHEQAVVRLAEPALDPLAKDADGNLLYPDVPVMDTVTGQATAKTTTNPALTLDASSRKDAQAIIDRAAPETLALVAKRKAAREVKA